VARHGLSAAAYQTEFNKWTQQGYKPSDISAYTVNGQDLYAVIFDKVANAPAWVARHGLSANDYQVEFNKWTGQGYRLTIVSVNGSGRYAALWEKKNSLAWQARHAMIGQQYQDEFDRQFYQGYRPVWINGATIMGQDSYAAIWEAKETFRPADMQKIDAAVTKFMNDYQVPGLSFAIAKDGRLVLVKTYGYANKETAEALTAENKNYFNYEVWETDHPFTNKRVALIKLVLSFLNK